MHLHVFHSELIAKIPCIIPVNAICQRERFSAALTY